MVYGKTIELFLVNGTADGIVTAELSNWSGKAIKLPRTEVSCCKREDVTSAGVYFLLCQDNDGSDSVYIGEAECVIDRLGQHLRDYQFGKETYYWNTALVFVGRDLNKAHIRYLENRLFDIVKGCGKYGVLTKNTYKNTVIKESEVASLEEFIENLRVLTNALGYKFLEEAPHANESTVLFTCQGCNANASGFVSTNGFTIVKGSTVSDHLAPSFEVHNNSYFKLRNQLQENGIIANNTFTSDYEFRSPSAAASIVLGHSANGNTEWKSHDGKKLKEIEL